MTQTVVLTNGSWHGAWAWSLVAPHLAARGLSPVALELEGFGGLRGRDPVSRHARPFDQQSFATEVSPVAGITLDHAVRALLADISALGRGPVVAVAHSLGGTVVAEAAQRAPRMFSGLVFVSAMTPVLDRPASAYNTLPEMAGSMLPGLLVADPAAVGAIRADFDSPEGRDLAHQALYADVPPALADRALSMLTSDTTVGVDGRVDATADAFGAIPRTWVLCTEDRILTPAVQRRLVRELDQVCSRPTAVAELASSHSPFLSRPAELAGVIAGAS